MNDQKRELVKTFLQACSYRKLLSLYETVIWEQMERSDSQEFSEEIINWLSDNPLPPDSLHKRDLVDRLMALYEVI